MSYLGQRIVLKCEFLLQVQLYSVFLECICSDNKSLPMGSLLVRHIYWIGCTPKHTSVSLSFHSLAFFGLCFMSVRVLTHANRLTKKSVNSVNLLNSLNGTRKCLVPEFSIILVNLVTQKVLFCLLNRCVMVTLPCFLLFFSPSPSRSFLIVTYFQCYEMETCSCMSSC